MQGLPLHVLHHDERSAVVLGHVVDGADVGMIERRGGACFAKEPLAGIPARRQIRKEYLDRDFAFELRVLGEEHFAHSAAAKGRADPVVRNRAVGFQSGGILAQIRRADLTPFAS